MARLAPSPRTWTPAQQSAFYASVIRSLGMTPTPAAVRILRGWAVNEGTRAGYNPLATTLRLGLPGETGFNSVGVQNYPTAEAGARATARTLRGYPSVLSALRSGNVGMISEADARKWSGGGYGAAKIRGQVGAVAALPLTPGATVSAPVTPVRAGVPAPAPAPMGAEALVPVQPQIDLRRALALLGANRRDVLAGRMPAPARYAALRGLVQTAQSQAAAKAAQAASTAVGSPGAPTTPATVGGPTTKVGGAAGGVIKAALSQKGVPYLWGGTAPGKGLDCSGLVQYAWKQAGVTLPRTTYDQIKVGVGVDPKTPAAWQPGDLLFPSTHHVMLYIGNGKAIEAPYTGARVRVVPVSSRSSYVAVRRPAGRGLATSG